VRRVRAALVERAARAASRLRHPRRGAALPDSALSAGERALLRHLRAARPSGAAPLLLTDDAAPSRSTPEGVCLGRAHPDVVAALRAVAGDPSAAYVAALVLCDDASPDPRARADWRARMAGPQTS